MGSTTDEIRALSFEKLTASELSRLKESPFQVGHIALDSFGEKYYNEKRWANIEINSGFISPTSRTWSVCLELDAPSAWHLCKPQWERV